MILETLRMLMPWNKVSDYMAQTVAKILQRSFVAKNLEPRVSMQRMEVSIHVLFFSVVPPLQTNENRSFFVT